MPLLTGQVLLNRYRIVHIIRQGGMGAVYRAWDLNLKKPVALKENLEFGLEAREQFNREATILANLSHPNLPRVTDHFYIENQGQYLVMDFIDGEDLESMVDRLGPIPEETATAWFLQISSALAYLHRRSSPVIHRDIKPANIKITPEGRAMLVDFGIAKFFGHDRVTMDGAKAVTPGFSPVEQYHASTDARSDIYSFGSTLYTVVTGEYLLESTRLALGEAKYLPPRQLNPQLSPALEAVILKSIEIQPERRYQSANELLAALEHAFQRSSTSAPNLLQDFPPVSPVESPQLPESQTQTIEESKPAAIRPKVNYLSISILLLGFTVVCAIVVASVIFMKSRGSQVASVSTATVQFTTEHETVIAPASSITPLSSTSTPPISTLRPTSLPPLVTVPLSNIPTEIHTGTPIDALLTLDRNYNCRGGTSREYDIIRTLEQGTQLTIIGKSENQWWLVRLNDPNTRRKQCWIYGGIPSGDLSAVPLSNWTGTAETAMTPWP